MPKPQRLSMDCPTTSSSRRPDAASCSPRLSSTSTSTPRPTRTRAGRTGSRARLGEGIPCSACTRSCPGSGTSAGLRRGRGTPRGRHRGRAPARVLARAGREPLQSLRRRTCRRRSRRRARHGRGGGRAHTRSRRRLRHRLGVGEARCCLLETAQPERAVELSRRWRGPDAHPRRLEGVQPRAAHTVLAGAGSARARPSAQPALPRSRQRTCGFPSLRLANRAAAAVALHSGDTALLPNAHSPRPTPPRKSEPQSRARARARSRPSARTSRPERPGRRRAPRAAAAFEACGAALPRQRRARAREARSLPPPAHARRQKRRDENRVADRTRAPGGTASSSTAGRIPRSPPSCSSARRRSRRTRATSSERSTSRTRRARTRRCARRRRARTFPLAASANGLLDQGRPFEKSGCEIRWFLDVAATRSGKLSHAIGGKWRRRSAQSERDTEGGATPMFEVMARLKIRDGELDGFQAACRRNDEADEGEGHEDPPVRLVPE